MFETVIRVLEGMCGLLLLSKKVGGKSGKREPSRRGNMVVIREKENKGTKNVQLREFSVRGRA
jgi:hypothetical protein